MSATHERQFGQVLVQPDANVIANAPTTPAMSVKKPQHSEVATTSTTAATAATTALLPDLVEARAKYQELKRRNMQLGEHFDTLKDEYFKLEKVNEDIVTELDDTKADASKLSARVEELESQVQELKATAATATAPSAMAAAAPGDTDAGLKIEGLTISNEILREQVREAEKTEATLRVSLEESQRRAQVLEAGAAAAAADAAAARTAAVGGLEKTNATLRAELGELREAHATNKKALRAEIQQLRVRCLCCCCCCCCCWWWWWCWLLLAAVVDAASAPTNHHAAPVSHAPCTRVNTSSAVA
jgi:hypothetical protein